MACHQADYDGEHATAGFPTTCLSCHTQTGWDGAQVDHAALSGGFQLVGSHASAACTDCHAVPGYTLLFPDPATQDDCVACHQADYDGEHAGSGFPTTCLSCHTQTGWDGAQVDHVALSGGFQLVGSHASAACTDCHAVPGYTLLFPDPATQDDCVACHQSDYDGEHATDGFPTTCLSCHNVDTWSATSFDHDAQFFPIYSGSHQGRWNQCADCHTVPGDFGSFSCTTCHTRSNTDRDHSEVSGYTYETSACFACHPRGRGD